MKPADQAAGFKIIIHYLFGTLLHWNFIETKPIAQRLHALRKSKNLTLDELSDTLNYSKPTVYKWEKGWKNSTGENTIPTMDQIIDLCSLYNCAPGYILCEYDSITLTADQITRETGILDFNIKKLNSMASSIINGPGGANDLFLSFLNYFIANMGTSCELLFNRSIIESIIEDYESSEYKDIVDAAYSKFSSDPLSIDILRDGFFGSRDGNRDTFKPYLVDEFVSAGYSKEKSTKLAEECSCFVDHLIGQFEANSNYVLSQEFVFLIESFFEDSDIRWDYSELLKRTDNNPESC